MVKALNPCDQLEPFAKSFALTRNSRLRGFLLKWVDFTCINLPNIYKCGRTLTVGETFTHNAMLVCLTTLFWWNGGVTSLDHHLGVSVSSFHRPPSSLERTSTFPLLMDLLMTLQNQLDRMLTIVPCLTWWNSMVLHFYEFRLIYCDDWEKKIPRLPSGTCFICPSAYCLVLKPPADRMIQCCTVAQSLSIYFLPSIALCFGAEWNLVPYSIL